jgi:hypothetical protein
MSDSDFDALVTRKNHLVQSLECALRRKSPNPSEISKMAQAGALVELDVARWYLANGGDIKDFKINMESCESMAIMSVEWGNIANLSNAKVAKELRSLAKGESRDDAKDIRDIANLIESGKLVVAYKKFQGLDTFMRDLFPDDCLQWLWFYGPRSLKGRGVGSFPTGAHLVVRE